MKHKSRLELLMVAVHRWLELPRVSRAGLAAEVVAAVGSLGMERDLAREGISFAKTDDPYNDSRINAQKIFRWLGQYQECHPNPERLFHVEQALLAAMPAKLRVTYLNDVFGLTGVTVVGDSCSDAQAISLEQMAAVLTKENSEAQIAVITLGPSPSREQLIECHRELKESRASTESSIMLLETEFPFLRPGRVHDA
ncbi:hypothetical protein MJ923_07775 [Shewanella sp. 3B26]|uniref:Bacterial toxin YdaT domain-containing protein n=1 Tax=Shewanella zhuhaiensis TaxID=2919576 RepID=A0AAJ1F061_9GAMM|nr:hypothetical protein [Shewanella zhuhaiensis]MCH4294202.1 hypothetical protein [Shewanella zhuhaiensis]